jgi:chaperonin GroES
MNFKPLSNHIFLEPLEEEKMTKSGIVIPDTAEKEKPIRGKVLAIGPGKTNDKGERMAMSVKVGDIVLFKKYGPDDIEIDGKKYLVGDEDDILAIIN